MCKTAEILVEKPKNEGWIMCSQKLPEMPSENKRAEYLVCWGQGRYAILGWCGGWNCSYNLDGSINRNAEIEGVIAWMPIPPYEIGGEANE